MPNEQPTPEEIEAIMDWDWPTPQAREYARELCINVAAAQNYSELMENNPLHTVDARGLWEIAAKYAATLRTIAPGPYPPLVEDAMAATDDATNIEFLPIDAGH